MKMKISTFSMCRLKEVMDLRIRRSTINLSTKASWRILEQNKIFKIKYFKEVSRRMKYFKKNKVMFQS